MTLEELHMLKENLEILADGRDAKTGYVVDDTILKSTFNKRVLKDAANVIDYLLKLNFNPTAVDKRKKYAFYISEEDRKKIVLSKEPIPISMFTYRINALVDEKKMKNIKASQITAWLMKEGYLDEIEAEDGRKFKVLNEKSTMIGISSEKRESAYGRVYAVNLYDERGQKFIIDHLGDIIDSKEQ